MKCFVKRITSGHSSGDAVAGYRLLIVVLGVVVSLIAAVEAYSKEGVLSVESKITESIKSLYTDRDDVLIKVEKLPIQLREGAKVQGIDVVKLPEPGRAGLALIQYKMGTKVQSSYVAFRTYEKKQLFYSRRDMKRGERIGPADTEIKEAYVGKKTISYPEGVDCLDGKVLKRDIPAGSLITTSMIEEPQAIKRGQTLTIVAQNRRLIVQVPGKAEEGGRRGDFIRVKNLSSGRELNGRIIDGGSVAVDF